MKSETYTVFVRNWYKWQHQTCALGRRSRILVPNYRARKTYLAHGVSYVEARRLCEQYNSTHNPGSLSRKAEFSSV